MGRCHAGDTMQRKTEERPWGSFQQFTYNEQGTVKILEVQPHQSLSLQYHHYREEFWKVLKGQGKITIGETVHTGEEGDEFFIERGQQHRISTEDQPLQVLEISFGEFDENDEVRLEDSYRRIS